MPFKITAKEKRMILKRRKAKATPNALSLNDYIHDGVSVEELISTTEANEGEVTKETLSKTYTRLMVLKKRDADQFFKQNLQTMIKMANYTNQGSPT